MLCPRHGGEERPGDKTSRRRESVRFLPVFSLSRTVILMTRMKFSEGTWS
jgi:hypothetical protein